MPAALNRALYFSLQAAIGSRAGAAYRELMTLERAPRPQIDDLAEQRLGALLQRAVRSVPYYRDRVNPAAADDLAAFPVLTKQAIHENFSDLMTPELRAAYDARRRSPAYSWVAVQTGGSTGAPSTVIHDRALRDHGRAGRAYAQYLCGFPFGTPYLRLWGSMADIRRSKSSPVQRIIHALSRETVLNAFMLNAQRMQTYLGAINGSRCRHMMAYADAAHRLALFAEEAGIAVRPLQTIMSCASTLTDDIRETLQRVFGARIHNKYGSRECTDMACECEAGGLHVLEPTLRLEVADGNGRALPAGERGRILVTLLFSQSFPLIRYDIGDIGTLSDRTCPCGRSFRLLETIEGRAVEFLRGTDGSYVSPVYVRHVVGVVHNPGCIRRYQLVQDSTVDFRLRLEVEPGADRDALARAEAGLRHDLLAVLGPGARLQIQHARQLEETAAGKFLYCMNKTAGRH